MSFITAYPLFMIGNRVQYSPMFKTALERTANSNTYFALKHILKTEGVKGLYRGFVPGLINFSLASLPIFITLPSE